MRLAPVTFFLVVVTTVGCGGSPNFTEFSSPEGKFTILMPGTPEKKTQDALGLKLVMYGANVRNGAYAAGYADIPPGTPVDLHGAVDGIAKGQAGKILSEKDVTVEGATAREFEVESTKPKGHVAGRVFVINNRLYQIFAAGSNLRLADADIQKFLDSFKLKK